MGETRPRQHVLKTESERAFQMLLPAEWVIRPQNDEDYGIDSEVEIFEDGEPTGLLFKVQLKATDAEGSAGRTRSVKTKTLAYWASLDLPVLVVYYEAATGDLYGRWAHAHGVEVQERVRDGAHTTTFRFYDDNKLDPGTVAQLLLADVLGIRELRRLGVGRPISYEVATAGFDAQADASIRRALRGALDRSRVGFELANGKPAYLRIELNPDAWRVRLPADVGSITMTVESPTYFATANLEAAVADCLTGIAFQIANAGGTKEASKLLAIAARTAPLLRTPDFASFASAVMAHEGLHQRAFDFGLSMLLHEEAVVRAAGEAWIVPVRVIEEFDDLSIDRSELQRILEAKLDLEIEQGYAARAGTDAYNLAQFMRAEARWDEAAAWFERASQLEPEYLTRAYYFRERGGAYFGSNRADKAVEDYERALTLGGDQDELKPLLADALLHAGRFGDSLDIAEAWDFLGARLDRLMGVVGLVASHVIEVTGLRSQTRRGLTDDEVSAIGEPSDPSVCLHLLREADALHPQLWLDASSAVEEDALGVIVTAAHMHLDHPGLWATATLMALQLVPGTPVVQWLVDTGTASCGDDYLDMVREVVATAPSELNFTAEDVLTIERRIATAFSFTVDPVVRWFGDDDDVDVQPPERSKERDAQAVTKKRKTRKRQKAARRKNG